ncbi:MAG: 30S ribosomal protein S16, partial [Marmoricola sp.]
GRKKRDGKVIEEIGKYHPKLEPSFIEVVSDRAQYWLGVGAQPSEAVEAILKITGDWQRFKGLPGTEGTLRVAEPKRDKSEIFNEALKDAASEPRAGATTRKKSAPRAAAPVDEVPVAPAEEKAPAKAAEAAATKAEPKTEPKAAKPEAPAVKAAEEPAPEAPAVKAAEEPAPAEKAAEEPAPETPAGETPGETAPETPPETPADESSVTTDAAAEADVAQAEAEADHKPDDGPVDKAGA